MHSSTSIPQSDFYINKLTSIYKENRSNLVHTVASYKIQADNKRHPTYILAVDSKVYIDNKNLKVKWAGRKLGARRIGPLKVLEQINTLSYRIIMPTSSTAHNVFHVSRQTAKHLPPPTHQFKGLNPPQAVNSHLPE